MHHAGIPIELLMRQAELLASRAELWLMAGEAVSALESATASKSIAGVLRKRLSDDSLHLPFSSVFETANRTQGLAFVALGNFTEARDLLEKLRPHKDSVETVRVIERALQQKQSARNRRHSDEAVELAEADDKSLQEHWDDTEKELNSIARSIAEKILEAGRLTRRVARPDLFEAWLESRIDTNLELLRVREVSRALGDEKEFVSLAEARGRDFQRRVFESGELIPASAIRTGGASNAGPETDESLRLLRDSGRLIGLQHPDQPSRFGYPRWQFGHGEEADLIRSLQRDLSAINPWGRWKFFHTPSVCLDNLTPLEALGIETGKLADRSGVDRRGLSYAGKDLASRLVEAVEEFISGDE